MNRRLQVVAALLGIPALAIACAAMDGTTTLSGAPPNGASDAGGGAQDPDRPSGVPDNGVILVHAAASSAFRLCFANELDRLPQPDSKMMPEANVVGVERGTAVRIDPLRGSPGDVYLFDEVLIRGAYAPGQTGPSCDALLKRSAQFAAKIGRVDANLSEGVHLLVVTGCPASNAARTYTKAECGANYGGVSNIAVHHQDITGVRRTDPSELPVQIMHLSQPLESLRGSLSLGIEFASLTGDAGAIPIATSPQYLGSPAPATPTRLSYDGADAAVYDHVGFRVLVGSPDGGPSTVLEQSLASVQALSAPRELPTTYYSKASNYVLLLLGDPAPKLSDGGPDDDELRKLHLLAVPVVEPKADGGTDAAADGAQ